MRAELQSEAPVGPIPDVMDVAAFRAAYPGWLESVRPLLETATAPGTIVELPCRWQPERD